MADKEKPNLLFDCLVANIKTLKKLLYNTYDVTLEQVDDITTIAND